VKKRAKKKLFSFAKNRIRLTGFIVVILILLILPFSIKSYYLNKSDIKNTPTPTLIPTETPTITLSPTPEPPTTTTIYFTPTPTTPQYKYILWKTRDEIHLKVNPNVGFAIIAYLLDEKWNVVTNQAGFDYHWSMDDMNFVKPQAGPFSGCSRGIQEPCPLDHYQLVATGSGITLIRVNVTKDGQVVAATTFPLIVEK
jgi:hypothetical protein